MSLNVRNEKKMNKKIIKLKNTRTRNAQLRIRMHWPTIACIIVNINNAKELIVIMVTASEDDAS